MEHILVKMMSQLTKLEEEEKLAIENSFPIQVFEKDTYLLKQGQISKKTYLVIKGCVREYKLLDGEEKTTGFFTENQTVANFNSLSNKTPSKKNFVCSETSTLAVLEQEKENELYKRFPRFEKFCRTGVEQMLGKEQEKLIEFISLKPEQRYLKMLKERPDLLNRVPQYQIASYLGVKPETLSRIRNRVFNKKQN